MLWVIDILRRRIAFLQMKYPATRTRSACVPPSSPSSSRRTSPSRYFVLHPGASPTANPHSGANGAQQKDLRMGCPQLRPIGGEHSDGPLLSHHNTQTTNLHADMSCLPIADIIFRVMSCCLLKLLQRIIALSSTVLWQSVVCFVDRNTPMADIFALHVVRAIVRASLAFALAFAFSAQAFSEAWPSILPFSFERLSELALSPSPKCASFSVRCDDVWSSETLDRAVRC
jgi:hypothetical protein